MDPVQEFYDGWADDYHLIFDNWSKSIQRQSKALHSLIQSKHGSNPHSLLDCTCGIGTQAIGLATQGYKVTASDLSPKAVERAVQEAQKFGVTIEGKVADLRSLGSTIPGQFDVVISCDNSLCHLLEPNDLTLAARQVKDRVSPQGIFLASIRDYDAIKDRSCDLASSTQKLPGDFGKNSERPTATLPQVFEDSNGKRVVFQLWDWSADGGSYGVSQFTLFENGGDWKTTFRASRFRAFLRNELAECLKSVGFRDVQWHMPEETGFYQPIVTARG